MFQDMLTGDHCCFDIRGGLQGWDGGDPDWGKKCCSNKVTHFHLKYYYVITSEILISYNI